MSNPSSINTMKNPSQSPRKSKKALIILAVTALLLVSVGAATYWWHNRPITPTVLDAQEQKVIDQKIEVAQKRNYQPGDKTISLSEREVNALFHHNTGLGDKVKFELVHHAIHARIRTELDPDLPVVGGKTLKAKARILLKDSKNHPAIILDDVTVWGISLPNAWLADLKGQNLISDLGLDESHQSGSPFAEGIKDIQVNNGEITIELAE
jgi:hypothetical protein